MENINNNIKKNSDNNEEARLNLKIERIIKQSHENKSAESVETLSLLYQMLMARQSEISKFKDNKKENYTTKEELEELFNKFNLYASAGFDYYYVSDLKDRFQTKLQPWATSHVLINIDHLKKLKSVIDCDDDLDFISYQEGENTTRYAIWLKKGTANINLIPFSRDMNNCITVYNGDNSPAVFGVKETEQFFKSEVAAHKGLAYRKLTSPFAMLRYR